MHVRNINAFCERMIVSTERLIKEGGLGSARLVNNGVLLPGLSRSLFSSMWCNGCLHETFVTNVRFTFFLFVNHFLSGLLIFQELFRLRIKVYSRLDSMKVHF